MKQQTDRRAQNLLDAMGGIDDRFLAEAIETIAAQRKRRRPKRLPRILAVAAALALVVGIGLAGGRLLHGILFPNREPTPDGSSDAPADFCGGRGEIPCAEGCLPRKGGCVHHH